MKGKDQPGLAMSRAIGDQMAASVGVICDPGKFKCSMIIIYRYNSKLFGKRRVLLCSSARIRWFVEHYLNESNQTTIEDYSRKILSALRLIGLSHNT